MSVCATMGSIQIAHRGWLAAAVGHLGQFIVVRPDSNLIIVRLGTETSTSVNWPQLFQQLASMFEA